MPYCLFFGNRASEDHGPNSEAEMEINTTPAPKRGLTAHARVARRARIFARLREGFGKAAARAALDGNNDGEEARFRNRHTFRQALYGFV